MSTFYKYRQSQRSRDHLTRSGFDPEQLRREYAQTRGHQAAQQTARPKPQGHHTPSFFERAKALLAGRASGDHTRDQISRVIAWPAALVVSCGLPAFDGHVAQAEAIGSFRAELQHSLDPSSPQLGKLEETTAMSDNRQPYEPQTFIPRPIYGQEEASPTPDAIIEPQLPLIHVVRLNVHQPPAVSDGNLLVQLWILALTLGGAALAWSHIYQRRLLQLKVVSPRQEPADHKPAMEETSDRPSWSHTLSVATRQGLVRAENQDAVWGCQFRSDCSALIVCDGAGGIEGGREASQQAIGTMSAHLIERYESQERLTLKDLTRAIQLAREANQTAKLQGVTTAIVALMRGDELIYATLGDGALSVLWPDGMVTHLQATHHTAGQPSNIITAFVGHACQVPPRVGWQRLEPGCLVMLMSDGASDIFPFDDLALNRTAHWQALVDQPLTYADHFLQQLEQARDEGGAYYHSDNLSLGLMGLQEISHG